MSNSRCDFLLNPTRDDLDRLVDELGHNNEEFREKMEKVFKDRDTLRALREKLEGMEKERRISSTLQEFELRKSQKEIAAEQLNMVGPKLSTILHPVVHMIMTREDFLVSLVHYHDLHATPITHPMYINIRSNN